MVVKNASALARHAGRSGGGVHRRERVFNRSTQRSPAVSAGVRGAWTSKPRTAQSRAEGGSQRRLSLTLILNGSENLRAEHAWKDGDSRAEVAAFVESTIHVRQARRGEGRLLPRARHRQESATRLPRSPRPSMSTNRKKKILRRNALTANMEGHEKGVASFPESTEFSPTSRHGLLEPTTAWAPRIFPPTSASSSSASTAEERQWPPPSRASSASPAATSLSASAAATVLRSQSDRHVPESILCAFREIRLGSRTDLEMYGRRIIRRSCWTTRSRRRSIFRRCSGFVTYSRNG